LKTFPHSWKTLFRRLKSQIPVIAEFADDEGNDVMQQVVEHNNNQIKADVKQIVA
jgi:hypothetical protein